MSFKKKLLVFSICLMSACSSDNGEIYDYEVIFLDEFTKQVSKFEEYFYNANEIDLSFGEESGESIIPVIYALEVNGQGDFAIPDHSNNTIALFDSTGRLKKAIGEGEGRGPGEFEAITTFRFDDNDNLWVYDPRLLRLSVFSSPTYELTEVFDIEMYFGDMLISTNKNLILYTYHHDESLIFKLNKNGELLDSTLVEENETLKTFLSRFQGGGLRKGFDKETFFAVYPGEFAIFEIGMDFEIQKKVTTRDSNLSDFRPIPPAFPSRLNPYDYTEAHAIWWYSFLHLSRLFTVEPNRLILSMYEQTDSQEYSFFLNMYDSEGRVIVEGLPLPKETRVVGAWKNKIFFARDEQMMSDGTIIPQRLTSYEIKHTIH